MCLQVEDVAQAVSVAIELPSVIACAAMVMGLLMGYFAGLFLSSDRGASDVQ